MCGRRFLMTSVPLNVVDDVQVPKTTEARGGFVASGKRALAFLGWLLTGFGLLGYLFRRRRAGASRAEEIVVYTVHPSFYLWAIILVGFVAAACVKHWPLGATAWGWAY